MNVDVDIAAVQLNIKDATSKGDADGNLSRMVEFTSSAAAGGAQLVVFPELANTGYYQFDQPETLDFYATLAESVPGPTTEALGSVARQHDIYVITGVLQAHPRIPRGLFNSAVLIGPSGRPLGIQHKMHLGFDDRKVFYPGSTARVHRTELGDVGMLVCYDAVFPESARLLALGGAEIIVAVFAAPTFVPGGGRRMEHLASVRARENGVFFVACSRVGKQGALEYVGGSTIAAPTGEIVAQDTGSEESTVVARLDHDILTRQRRRQPILRDRRPELYGLLAEAHSDADQEAP